MFRGISVRPLPPLRRSASDEICPVKIPLCAFALDWLGLAAAPACLPATTPVPHGIYVLDDVADDRNAAKVYATGLDTCAAYRDDIAGDAIFVPIAKILPAVTTWGAFDWQWGYLDTLTQFAVAQRGRTVGAGRRVLRSSPGFGAAGDADHRAAPMRFFVWVLGAIVLGLLRVVIER